MFFVRSVSSLLVKALALCDKAIGTADKTVQLANEKKLSLKAKMNVEDERIYQAQREQQVAQNIKAKIEALTNNTTSKWL